MSLSFCRKPTGDISFSGVQGPHRTMGGSNAADCEEKDWPVFRRGDVQTAAKVQKKVLITHKEGVYDLTEFAAKHPGGADKLLMANGGPIEPFWEMYPFHKEEVVYKLLAQYKVGKLHPDDILDVKDLPDFKDLQTQNLGRSEELRLLQKYPYCAETPSS